MSWSWDYTILTILVVIVVVLIIAIVIANRYQPAPRTEVSKASAAPATPQTTTTTVIAATSGSSFWAGFWKVFWWLVLVGVVAGMIWFAWKVSSDSSPRQTAAPQLQKKTFNEKLRFIGGEKIVHQFDGTILIQNGGYLELEIEGLPTRRGTRYWIKLSIQRESDGRHFLSINGAPPYQLQHLASPRVENKVFASDDFGGGEGKFRKGEKNFFRFSSPGGNCFLHSASIEAEWEE